MDISSPPAPGFRVLGQSAVAVSHTGSITATTLGSVVVPAGSMGPNGRVRITTLSTFTNSANAKTLRTLFGGSIAANASSTTTAQLREFREIMNVASVSSQKMQASNLFGTGNTTSVITTLAVDTSVDVTIAFQAVLTNTGETITLEAWCVEVAYGA